MNNIITRILGSDDENPNQKNKQTSVNQENKNTFELFEPASRKDIKSIAKTIMNGKTAFVDFQKFSESKKEQYLQFLAGVLFAVDGGYYKKSDNEYFLSSQKDIINGMDKK